MYSNPPFIDGWELFQLETLAAEACKVHCILL